MEFLQHSALFSYIPTPTCLHPGQVTQGTLPGLCPITEMAWLHNYAIGYHAIGTHIPPLAQSTHVQD